MDSNTKNRADERASVAVLGLGQLGSALAGAFLKGGHPTTVWNRSGEKAEHLTREGANRTAASAEAVSASTLVVVCVSDYAAVSEILDLLSETLAGKTLVNLSSGTPEQAREMAAWAAGYGADYLDGAVMSSPYLVGQPEAVLLYAGSPAAFRNHGSALKSLGGATHLGADPGVASLYDAALFGMNWGLLTGFLHAAALVGTEGVGETEFASVATGYLSFMTGLLPDIARQIEEGRYPDDDGTIEVHAAAMDHLLRTSLDHGIGADMPQFVKALLERGIATGHGTDGLASFIEVVKRPSPAA